ncbi:MAG: hypothetical protein HGJ94_01250 [Desulfosarcina sp.]|nr:hypothetical protein [Desulfosarcina sp.]MBC2741900.1 hypothetical protein [Desulfosarcina sp.]MBC2764813.1 hypothetical protein [Desulfosarcina sp.]
MKTIIKMCLSGSRNAVMHSGRALSEKGALARQLDRREKGRAVATSSSVCVPLRIP